MTAPQEPVDQDAGADLPADDLQAELAAVRAELAAAQAQAQAQQEQALRAMAEAENVRRRAQEDVSKARKFGIESFAESLVPVKDSLEAEVTLRQLTSAFERNLLKEVAPAPGDKFDPHLHQAISSVPAEQPANTVVQLLQKGYVIADRTLRPALVVVSAG